MTGVKRMRRCVVLALAAITAGSVLVACGGGDGHNEIGYLVDARIDGYNANTLDGASSGVGMALTRVLPGFSFQGPDGQSIADHDIGTVTPVEGATLTIAYEFAAGAVYSDGHAMSCDDVLLAATALGGKVPGFDQASTAGYRDIDKVECEPNSRKAVVTFAPDRSYVDWAGLFGAGTLLPAHVVGKLAGVPDVANAIRRGNKAQLAKIAEAWNTGFTLSPGKPVDPAVLLSAGPYRVAEYTAGDGLVLQANEKWWGRPPLRDRIAVWPRGTDQAKALEDGRIQVVDTADLAAADTVTGTDPTSASGSAAADRRSARDPAALSVEQVVFAGRGVLADRKLRQAFAACVPRDTIARKHGANGLVWNLHIASPADSLGSALNSQFALRYPRADPQLTKKLMGERSRHSATVRIGYIGPDPVRGDVVKQIAESCAPLGITVTDVASPTLRTDALGTDADALLIGGGAWFAAGGGVGGSRDTYQLFRGDPSNIGGFADGSVAKAITELAVNSSDTARLPLLREVETDAWNQLAAVPLFATVRGRGADASVSGVVPGLGASGTGWNMDRWSRE